MNLPGAIRALPPVLGFAMLAFAGGCRATVSPPAAATAAAATQNPHGSAARPAISLGFDDFFLPGTSTIQPAPKLLEARGKRVRLVGFMAQLELPVAQGFYLTRRPLVCDEAGGGTADLPPDAVRVLVTPAPAQAIPFVPGPIEVVGVLEVGHLEEANGTVSQIRLLLKGDGATAPAKTVSTALQEPKGG
jgi:hypothetical protein